MNYTGWDLRHLRAFRGNLIYQLKELDDLIVTRLIRLVTNKIHIRKEEVVLGHWACAYSPTKQCVYNKLKDPLYDYCLFCSKPDQRV